MVATSQFSLTALTWHQGITDSLNFLRSTPLAAHRHHPEGPAQQPASEATMPGFTCAPGRDGRVQPAITTGGITHSDQQQRRRSSKLAPNICRLVVDKSRSYMRSDRPVLRSSATRPLTVRSSPATRPAPRHGCTCRRPVRLIKGYVPSVAPLPGIGLRTGGSGLEIVLLLAGAILPTRFATWLGGGSQAGSTPALGGGRAFPGSWQLPRTASVPPRRAMASPAWQRAGRLEFQVLRPGWQFRAGASMVRRHRGISSSFMILPMAFFGSSSRNSITRGYL